MPPLFFSGIWRNDGDAMAPAGEFASERSERADVAEAAAEFPGNQDFRHVCPPGG